jgi:hypothetical protein
MLLGYGFSIAIDSAAGEGPHATVTQQASR